MRREGYCAILHRGEGVYTRSEDSQYASGTYDCECPAPLDTGLLVDYAIGFPLGVTDAHYRPRTR